MPRLKVTLAVAVGILPAVGVVAFGWDPGDLLLFFVLELAMAMLLGGVRVAAVLGADRKTGAVDRVVLILFFGVLHLFVVALVTVALLAGACRMIGGAGPTDSFAPLRAFIDGYAWSVVGLVVLQVAGLAEFLARREYRGLDHFKLIYRAAVWAFPVLLVAFGAVIAVDRLRLTHPMPWLLAAVLVKTSADIWRIRRSAKPGSPAAPPEAPSA